MYKANLTQLSKRKLLLKLEDLNQPKNVTQEPNLLFHPLMINHKCQKLLRISSKRTNNTYKK
jgi:hypothetical protein